jgi:hypothetical protein
LCGDVVLRTDSSAALFGLGGGRGSAAADESDAESRPMTAGALAASALAMSHSASRPVSSHTARRATIGLYPDTLLDELRPASAHVTRRSDLMECDRIKAALARSGVTVARGVLERALVAPQVTFTTAERTALLPSAFDGYAHRTATSVSHARRSAVTHSPVRLCRAALWYAAD